MSVPSHPAGLLVRMVRAFMEASEAAVGIHFRAPWQDETVRDQPSVNVTPLPVVRSGMPRRVKSSPGHVSTGADLTGGSVVVAQAERRRA